METFIDKLNLFFARVVGAVQNFPFRFKELITVLMSIRITFSADREPWDSSFMVLVTEDVDQSTITCVQSEKYKEYLSWFRFFFGLLESFWSIAKGGQMEAFFGPDTMMTSFLSL